MTDFGSVGVNLLFDDIVDYCQYRRLRRVQRKHWVRPHIRENANSNTQEVYNYKVIRASPSLQRTLSLVLGHSCSQKH
jgi:hypothetical protein